MWALQLKWGKKPSPQRNWPLDVTIKRAICYLYGQVLWTYFLSAPMYVQKQKHASIFRRHKQTARKTLQKSHIHTHADDTATQNT